MQTACSLCSNSTHQRWPLMYSSIPCVYKLFPFCCCRRPRRGFPNSAKWSHGKSWAVGKQRRAAAQTATMKMGVKHRETARAKTVSGTKSVHTQFYSAFFLTLSAGSGQIFSVNFLFVHITKCRCLWPQSHVLFLKFPELLLHFWNGACCFSLRPLQR